MTQTPPATPPAGATPVTQTTTPAAGATPEELTWDSWLAKQPETERKQIEALHAKRVQTLEGTLTKERDERKDLEKKLREMAKTSEAGSEAQKQLTAVADQLANAEKRADFYRDALKAEVADPEGAWLIANGKADEFFDKRGSVNFDLLKKEHPGLFAQPKPTPRANVGSGTQNNDGNAAVGMNSFIRRAAGRG